MENTIETITYSTIDVNTEIQEANKDVEKYVKDNGFILAGNPSATFKEQGVKNQSDSAKKKIIKKIRKMRKKGSIRSVNSFLYELSKIMKYPIKTKVKVSQTEKKIRDAKKVLNTKKAEYDLALSEYKNAKGDFFLTSQHSQNTNISAFII